MARNTYFALMEMRSIQSPKNYSIEAIEQIIQITKKDDNETLTRKLFLKSALDYMKIWWKYWRE
jgi:hypothetical protein